MIPMLIVKGNNKDRHLSSIRDKEESLAQNVMPRIALVLRKSR